MAKEQLEERAGKPQHGHRGWGRPKNSYMRELENLIWTTGFNYSCKKM